MKKTNLFVIKNVVSNKTDELPALADSIKLSPCAGLKRKSEGGHIVPKKVGSTIFPLFIRCICHRQSRHITRWDLDGLQIQYPQRPD